MKLKLALYGLLALLCWGCQQPVTQPDPQPITIYAGNNDGNGGSNSGQQCVNPDLVDIAAPSQLNHSGPGKGVSLTPSVAGQVQTSNICAVQWIVPDPCSVANPGALSTVLTASSTGACTVQGKVGTTLSVVVTVTVN